MKCLLFVILAGCAVKCDNNNYYVIEMPEDRLEDEGRPFNVYWNVPTMQCKSKKIPFENLYEKYGILQNKKDNFWGEEISILYDPGLFPALLKNETSGEFKLRNGGVPQEGNLELHLKNFRRDLDEKIPDPDFRGVGIIDFESWRPIFRQNFGVLEPYKTKSIEIERHKHSWWPKQWIQAEAKRRFEESARTFMQTTLSIAKQMRPHALWGYYGYPYCFNMGPKNMKESCADKVPQENDRTDWLWSESTALYPSVYSSKGLSSTQLAGMIRGRIKESGRVKRKNTAVLPYFWYRYRDGGFLSEEDLKIALESLYKSKTSGFIIWGSSHDVNTNSKCIALKEYVENMLGPAIAAYTKSKNTRRDVMPVSTEGTTTSDPVIQDIQENINDPEFHWDPSQSYAQDIKNYVEEEIKRNGYNFNKLNETLIYLNESTIMKILLNSSEERNITKNEKKGFPYIDLITDVDRDSYNSDTSQSIDLSSGNGGDKSTSTFYSTESLPTKLIDEIQTENKETSPEISVTTQIQYSNTPEISSTISSTEYLPRQKTSQFSSSEFLVPILYQNQQSSTEVTTSKAAETTEYIDDIEKKLSTGAQAVQDDLKNEENELYKPLPTTDYQIFYEKTSSMEVSPMESQEKQTSTQVIDNISKETTSDVTDDLSKPTTESLAKNDAVSMEESNTESTKSSELSDKTFSGEYLVTSLSQNKQTVRQDSTTDRTTDDIDNHNTEIAINYNDNDTDVSETTTLETLTTKVFDIETSRIYTDYPNYDDQTQTHESTNATENYTDFIINDGSSSTSIDNNYASDIIVTEVENEKEQDVQLDELFFNQDTYFENTESPEITLASDNSTKIEGFGSLETDRFIVKEEMGSTEASTTEIDQVNVYVL